MSANEPNAGFRPASSAWFDAVSRVMCATGLAILLLAVAIIIAVRLLAMAFPGALDGRDVIASGLHPNYLRNAFELESFISGLLVVLTAILAARFTISQIKEAEKTRLATLYTTLETRWASAEMLDSKIAFYEISKAYETVMALQPVSKQGLTFEDFADQYLSQLSRNDYAAYSSVISLIDFFEYIGMLARSRYLRIDDIKYLLGTVCIEVYTAMSVHINAIKRREAARSVRNGIANAPEQYFCFQFLVDEFKRQFRTASRQTTETPPFDTGG